MKRLCLALILFLISGFIFNQKDSVLISQITELQAKEAGYDDCRKIG